MHLIDGVFLLEVFSRVDPVETDRQSFNERPMQWTYFI